MEAVEEGAVGTKDKEDEREESPFKLTNNPGTQPRMKDGGEGEIIEGIEWNGSDEPITGMGAWFNHKTKESFHPDLKSSQHEPHWDYRNRQTKERSRHYLDGTMERK
ncbi:MAG: hypothetical protein H0U70_12175 [Tatlockia sp.]|nr:hypothetical protein [Tatlockia sp.]